MLFVFFRVVFGAVPVFGADTRADIKLLLTSNIQGRSVVSLKNQASRDPLLLLAQNIEAERKKGVDLYLDLGNAFYPGVLSKYSSGSLMMDFFDDMGCAATLISSKDLHVGLTNLEYLQRNGKVRLLSANIERPDRRVFTPYFIAKIKGVRIAFVGISSNRLEFDISEKDLYSISLKDEKEALEPILKELSRDGVSHIILLTGMRIDHTMQLLTSLPRIDMALCGGDFTGSLYKGKVSRIDLADGRSIVMLDERFDYYVVDIAVDGTMHLSALQPYKARPMETHDFSYLAFVDRLSLWKTKYLHEQSEQIASAERTEYRLDDLRLSQLLRDRFNSEIAIVDEHTINSYSIGKDIHRSDLLRLVNLDYNIFTFFLSGDELSLVQRNRSGLVVAGLTQGKAITVQGYPLEKGRKYKVAATQSAFEDVERLLGRQIAYKNSWTTVTDLLVQDLKHERVTLRSDYSYLDRRFRTLLDVSLSNFIGSGDVHRSGDVETPVDQPAQSYSKWGLEDRLDLTFYNKYHRFVLSPYLFYVRQDDEYIQNLLRGTLLYEYNLNRYLRPYNKFQCDTVVEKVQNQRPILIRETMGLSTYRDYLSGRLGLGFEKKIQDPADDAFFGLETILGFKYPFLKYFTYTFDINNFASIRNGGSRLGLRSEIDNAISARINAYLSISLRHKYFYLYEDETNGEYSSSQIYTTIDLITDWKRW
jgi:hypothetical protein